MMLSATWWYRIRSLALSLLALGALPTFVCAQEKVAAPAGGTVNVTVTTAAPPAPPLSLTLHERHGHVTPFQGRCAHTGGGLIDVATPAPDTVLVTMSGAAVANSEMKFDFDQCFEVNFDDPKVKKAKLLIEGRVIGLLRGERQGCAEYSDACARVTVGPTEVIGVCVPPHRVCGCDALSVNDHDGPKAVPVTPGLYHLQETFNISAQSNCGLFKKPSAEFAPDPALDPLWISYHEPFHGVKKESFGFQVIVKVVPDTDEAGTDKKVSSARAP